VEPGTEDDQSQEALQRLLQPAAVQLGTEDDQSQEALQGLLRPAAITAEEAATPAGQSGLLSATPVVPSAAGRYADAVAGHTAETFAGLVTVPHPASAQIPEAAVLTAGLVTVVTP